MDRTDVKKLLGFGFNEDRVFGFAKAGFNAEKFNKNLEILKGIGDKMLEVRDTLSDDEIRKLLASLHRSWKDGVPPESIDLTLMESRSVGYGLTEKTEVDFIYYLIKVEEADGNWTPSCLKGFLHSTLRHWYDFKPGVREAVGWFILNHSDKDAKDLSAIIPFIDEDGPSELGTFLRKNKKSWQWAPPTVLMPTTRLNYPYFGDTIMTYFKDVHKGEYDDLRSALNLHNHTRTDKILLPRLIIKAGKFNKDLLDIATKRIGDPFDESWWAPFDGADAEQKNNLRLARKVLLSWIMQEVIRMFFEVLCQDNDRKSFWSKQAHKVSDFTVFGSYYSKQLALNSLPSQNVNRHFRTVDSSMDNCALAMYIGEYVIIEFTQVGALYAYKKGGNNYRQAFRYANSLSKVDDLKISGMPMLYDLEYFRFASEGKMDHRGIGWKSRMERWMAHSIHLNEDDDE